MRQESQDARSVSEWLSFPSLFVSLEGSALALLSGPLLLSLACMFASREARESRGARERGETLGAERSATAAHVRVGERAK